MSTLQQPTFFLSHGGGPWPWLKKEMPFFEELERLLKSIPGQLPEKPKAVLVVSGHWEESEFTVMSAAHPKMVYDYGGFPDFTYHIKYPAPGFPDLAIQIQKILNDAGMIAYLNSERGFDHGTFSMMYPIFPNAEVPIVQVSMRRGYDPEEHIKLGRALAPLRREGVLILGSGNSYHNMRFPSDGVEKSEQFDQWLNDTLVRSAPDKRLERLLNWEKAPGARNVQPREDHFIPLMVAVGAAEGEQAKLLLKDYLNGGFATSSFRFG